MPVVLPVTEMQRNGAALIDQAISTKEPIYLTRRGRSAVVLMDAEEFDGRMRFQEDVYRREMRVFEGIREGRRQIEQGLSAPLDDVLAAIDQRLG